jgi:hypothetical protein
MLNGSKMKRLPLVSAETRKAKNNCTAAAMIPVCKAVRLIRGRGDRDGLLTMTTSELRVQVPKDIRVNGADEALTKKHTDL